MAVRDGPLRLATRIAGARTRSILFVFTAGYLAQCIPIAISLFVFNHYLHIVDTLTVLLAVALAVAIPTWIARLRLPWYEPEDRDRVRENRGWLLFAFGSLLILVGRSIYAVAELPTGEAVDSIPAADLLFGASFLFFVTGMLIFPWSDGRTRQQSSVLDASIVLVTAATLLWPIFIGPAVTGRLPEEVPTTTVSVYMGGIFILLFSTLWVIVRNIRSEVWPVAVALALSVGTMILIQVGYLGYLVASEGEQLPLSFVNSMTSLAFLLIAVAATLRLKATMISDEHEDANIADGDSPVHRLQILLPYPLVAGLLFMGLGMEFFGWHVEYRTEVGLGFALVLVLLMYRQVQLVRFNDALYRRVAGAAIRDSLTGLYNHRAMHELLQTQAAQADRTGAPLAVLFLDIDRFKRYNDTFGHRQGDGLLSSVADLLRTGIRRGDFVGRYGGEEFIIIAPNISAHDACRLAERLRASVEEQKFVHDGTRSSVTVSVGVAMYPEDGDDPEDVVQRADEAMYRAKAAGRNQTVVYRPA